MEGFAREVQLLVQPCRNRPAEFARCTRCPPEACQRRLLSLPVSVMLIFRCFLVQTGDFYFYGVCKFVFLGSPLGGLSPQVTEGLPATAANRFHKELRFFFSLLKRKKEAKKEKSSHFTCATRSNITRRLRERLRTRAIYFHRFSSTKIPRRGKQAAAAAVTLPLSQLKLGRRVSGGLLSLSKSAVAISAGRRADPPRKEAKKEKNSRSTCTIWQMHHTKCCLVIF